MKVRITKPCVIQVLPNSIVEVSEKQLKFMNGYFELIEEKETPEKAPKTTRKARK